MTPRHSGGRSAQPLARRLAVRPQVLPLEDRSLPNTTPVDPPAEPTTTPAEPTPPAAVAPPYLAVGTEAGNDPRVKVYDTATGQLKFDMLVYDKSFKGGVRVATGDVSGDGVDDLIVAPGPGSPPLVKVFDGETGTELKRFMAYDRRFTGGVFVAAGDTNGDGHAEIITGAGEHGGPHVKVFNGAWAVPPIVIQNDPTPDPATISTTPGETDTTPEAQTVPAPIDTTTELRHEFMAYDERFRGGVRVATGDVNNDGKADLITAAGPTGGPHVRVIDGLTFAGGAEWMAYAHSYSGGVFVSAGDLDGDGKAEVVTGAGNRGATQVKVFRGTTGTTVRSFTAAPVGTSASVRVNILDYDQDGRNDLLTSYSNTVQVRDGQTYSTKSALTPFDPSFRNGLFLG